MLHRPPPWRRMFQANWVRHDAETNGRTQAGSNTHVVAWRNKGGDLTPYLAETCYLTCMRYIRPCRDGARPWSIPLEQLLARRIEPRRSGVGSSLNPSSFRRSAAVTALRLAGNVLDGRPGCPDHECFVAGFEWRSGSGRLNVAGSPHFHSRERSRRAG